jgi:UDP-GlcNAc:undecaprenyl-phosphate GlcNAc-1-phosphate transferase
MSFGAAGLLFLIAAVIGLLSTWITRALAGRFGFVAKPNPIVASHTKPIPHIGGVGLASAVVMVLLLGASGAPLWPQVLIARGSGVPIGALLFLLIGTVDDIKPFGPGTKLILQMTAATAAVALGFPRLLAGDGYVSVIATILWLVTVVNAVNMTDVCDGLVGGIVALSLLAIGIARPELRAIAFVAAGATSGFLVFNVPPASIFLGDAGSHFLGFLLAAAAAAAVQGSPPPTALVSLVLLAGVPLFELLLLTVTRIRKGIPPWRGSPDHFALRLQSRGLSKLRTDAVAWLATVIFAGIALTLPQLSAIYAAGLLLVVAVASTVALRRLFVSPRSYS